MQEANNVFHVGLELNYMRCTVVLLYSDIDVSQDSFDCLEYAQL